MSAYEDLKQSAKKLDDICYLIEMENDPSVIPDLKRESISLKVIAEAVRHMEDDDTSMRNQCLRLKRILFYELLNQKDEIFIRQIKPIVGEDNFEWRAEHRGFCDDEIIAAMSVVMERIHA